ncbi:hypothetical protein C8R46DRAFT_1224054 [Mycena filopes]|nr:hypothetical protein C8R46DRAFT_1224054 [Mycena filopes]
MESTTHTHDSADANFINISHLPRLHSTRWISSFTENLQLFAAQRPTLAAGLLAQYLSDLTHLWTEFDQAVIIGDIFMIDEARAAIQASLQALISNIGQYDHADGGTQQATAESTEQEADNEIPGLVENVEELGACVARVAPHATPAVVHSTSVGASNIYCVLSAYTVPQIIAMLRQTTSLEKLVVEMLQRPRSTGPAIECDSVRVLEIKGAASISFLDCATLPKLANLTLTYCGEVALANLSQFMVRSRCQLRSISVNYCESPFAIRVLEVVPSVSKVHLGPCNDRQAMDFLVRLATDTRFLPNLQTLGIDYTADVPYAVVVQTLEARRSLLHDADLAQLESFRFTDLFTDLFAGEEPQLELDILARFEALVAKGMKIEIPSLREAMRNVKKIH